MHEVAELDTRYRYERGCVTENEQGQWFYDPDLSIPHQRGKVILPSPALLSTEREARLGEAWSALGLLPGAGPGYCWRESGFEVYVSPLSDEPKTLGAWFSQASDECAETADPAVLARAANILSTLQAWLTAVQQPVGVQP